MLASSNAMLAATKAMPSYRSALPHLIIPTTNQLKAAAQDAPKVCSANLNSLTAVGTSSKLSADMAHLACFCAMATESSSVRYEPGGRGTGTGSGAAGAGGRACAAGGGGGLVICGGGGRGEGCG